MGSWQGLVLHWVSQFLLVLVLQFLDFTSQRVLIILFTRTRFTSSRFGAVVRALASHQCDPGSIPGPGVMCGLSLLLVLFLPPRGFSPGTPIFLSLQKPTFPNSNSIWIIVKHFIMSLWHGWLRKYSLCLTLNLHFFCLQPSTHPPTHLRTFLRCEPGVLTHPQGTKQLANYQGTFVGLKSLKTFVVSTFFPLYPLKLHSYYTYFLLSTLIQ